MIHNIESNKYNSFLKNIILLKFYDSLEKFYVSFYSYKEMLSNTLSNAEFLSLTVDLSRARNLLNFVTLTGHLVDCKLNLHSLIIDHCHFTGAQTADKIESYIRDKMEEINVEIGKIACITCDSGSNVKVACSRITTRISCVCHNINLIIKKTFRLFDNK